jgi:hypothetical protein
MMLNKKTRKKANNSLVIWSIPLREVVVNSYLPLLLGQNQHDRASYYVGREGRVKAVLGDGGDAEHPLVTVSIQEPSQQLRILEMDIRIDSILRLLCSPVGGGFREGLSPGQQKFPVCVG